MKAGITKVNPAFIATNLDLPPPSYRTRTPDRKSRGKGVCMHQNRRQFLLSLGALIAGSRLAKAQPLLEGAERFYPSSFRSGLVVAGEKLATQVALDTLKEGGNAVDAAITCALALAVTLPRAGNLGGGGFMLIHNPQGEVFALDFREQAPYLAHKKMYLDQRDRAKKEHSRVGPYAAGIPGTVKGLAMALERFGSISWKRALEPAIQLAREGFPVSPWLSQGIRQTQKRFSLFPGSLKVFLPQGRVPKPGEIFRQPDLANTLQRLYKRGSEEFYQGETAQILVDSVKKAGGIWQAKDLSDYQAKWREPIRGEYRGNQIFSMPPPSSGGVHLVQMLNVLEKLQFESSQHNSADYLHFLAEIQRSAYADRSHWLGDPDFIQVPTQWLTSRKRADEIFAQIQAQKARKSNQVYPGTPPSYESQETTHFSIMDRQGWAVSFTYTLNFSYGCGFVADGTGILLNNEMDDFSVAPGQPNAYGLVGGEANSIQPRKRPLSSMTPTIVQKDGKAKVVLGAPGGSRIINGVLQALVNHLEFGFNPATSVALPRIHHQWMPDHISCEQGISLDTQNLLKQYGHSIAPIHAVAQVMMISKDPHERLVAGLDPRRPGSALGF